MIDSVSSLQTNVIATVRRDRTDLPAANNGTSNQTSQQNAPFVLNGTAVPQTRAVNPLDDQIAELINVAQAAAQASAGIEPKAIQASAYGRATAAYAQMNNVGYAKQQSLLSMTI